MYPRAPTSTLFPYTTLFRSCGVSVGDAVRMLDRAETVAGAPATRDALVAGRLSGRQADTVGRVEKDRKSTRLNSSHMSISYAVFCLKKKTNPKTIAQPGRFL